MFSLAIPGDVVVGGVLSIDSSIPAEGDWSESVNFAIAQWS